MSRSANICSDVLRVAKKTRRGQTLSSDLARSLKFELVTPLNVKRELGTKALPTSSAVHYENPFWLLLTSVMALAFSNIHEGRNLFHLGVLRNSQCQINTLSGK